MTTFLEPRARLTDPDTSHDAAVLAAPRASKHRIKAARVLARFPEGLTDFELAEKTGVAQTSIGKRRFELGEAGYVEDAGLKRPAPSGSPAKVWRITEAGATWLSAIDQHPSSTEKVSEPTEPVSAERRHRSRKPRPIHPAQYSKYLVPVLANALRRHVSSPAGQWRYLLDPFAGLGHRLAAIGSLAGLEPIGIEIEPGYFERKETHPCVRLGDSTELEDIFLTATVGPTFDAIVTSPTYPNGLNDDFHARDASKRNTYIHRLREHLGDGYELHPNSTARHGIRRGAKSVARYEELHRTVLEQCSLVLNPGGIFVLNAKDVLAGGEIRYSTASFFVRHLESLGFEVLEWFLVDAIGLLHGANRDRRTFEDVVILRKDGA